MAGEKLRSDIVLSNVERYIRIFYLAGHPLRA